MGSHDLLDARHFTLDKVARRPVGGTTTDLEEKIVEDLSAPGRMRYFRMELHRKERAPGMLERGDRGVDARCGEGITGRRGIDVVPMTHPDGSFFPAAECVEQATAALDFQ